MTGRGFADRADWAVFPGVVGELGVAMPARWGCAPAAKTNRRIIPIAALRMMHAAANMPTTMPYVGAASRRP